MSCASKTIAIVGNVGVGKTTLCGHLCKGSRRSRTAPGCRTEFVEASLDGAASTGTPKGWRRLSWRDGLFRARAHAIDAAPGSGSGPETDRRPASTPVTLVDTNGADAFLSGARTNLPGGICCWPGGGARGRGGRREEPAPLAGAFSRRVNFNYRPCWS